MMLVSAADEINKSEPVDTVQAEADRGKLSLHLRAKRGLFRFNQQAHPNLKH